VPGIEEEIARRLRGYEAARPVIAAARALSGAMDEMIGMSMTPQLLALRAALAELDWSVPTFAARFGAEISLPFDRPMAIEVDAALRAWPPIAKLLQPKKETK
jgi:hypothetical protein